MEDKNINLDDNNLREAIDEMNLVFFDWLKNITTIATGLIAVLISLKSSNHLNVSSLVVCDFNPEWFFFTTILSLSVGVFFSMIVSYQKVVLKTNAANEYKDRINKKKKQKIVVVDKEEKKFVAGLKYFPAIKKVVYCSYTLALISLVIYSFFISGLNVSM